MEDLLTVKEVQELLKVDRLTIYRMLKDGRLAGLKIGPQWRFSSEEVQGLIASARAHATGPAAHELPAFTSPSPAATAAAEVLPLHCVQLIQDVFGEIAGIGAVTVAPDGQPVTTMSNSCRFCNLIRSTEKGVQGCVSSWQRLAGEKGHQPHFATCHAGLNYAGARIELNGELIALIIAGQCYASEPNPAEQQARIERLAKEYGIDPAALAEAAREINVLDERTKTQLGKWLQSVAYTFRDIGRERSQLMGRLRTIAAMSTLEV